MTKVILLLATVAMLAGCTSRTEYGECIGLNGVEKPNLEYRYSGWNIAMGVIFFELVAPPIVVGLDELKCPVGQK